MSGRRSLTVWTYRALAACLPPDVRDDRDETVRTFADLYADTTGVWARAVLIARSLGALLRVLVVEWLEFIGVYSAPDRTLRNGRGGMGFGRNLRYALRTLRKAPAFTATSLLLVAVGVGAVTTIFTLVDHVLLRPLPYPDADRLVSLENGSFQGPYFQELEKLGTVEEWAAASTDRVNLVGEGDPLRLEQARVSRDFFDLFGASAQRGRLLGEEDFRTQDAVVLAAGTWTRVWGRDPSIIGRTIRLDGEALTVVGVVDDAFAPPEALTGRRIDVWRPLDWSSPQLQAHDIMVLQVAGRMRAGTKVAAVQAEVDALQVRMAPVHRNYQKRDGSPRDIPVKPLAEMTVQRVRAGLGLLMGAVSLLLLVACANVANLFLARGLGRTREMAVRRAMGAGTRTLVAQLLVESLVLGVGGGVLGTGLAWLGIRTFLSLNPSALPRQASIAMDPRVLAFAIGVSALTSVVFGLLPALRSVRRELADELRGSGRSATSTRGVALLRNGLVTAEVALSLVLVASAGLLLRSFLTVRGQDPGFAIADVWKVPLNLPQPDTPAEYLETMDAVLRQVQAVPGVRSVGYGLTVPMDRVGGSICCWMTTATPPEREGDQELNTIMHPVSLDYLKTLDIQVVAGRSWTEGEATTDPVPLVVNETFARALAGTTDAAVGMSVKFNQFAARVIGVAEDTRHYGLDQEIGNQLYLPIERLPFPIPLASMVVHVDPAANVGMPKALRSAIWAAAPGLPITTVRPMQAAVDESTAGRRFDSVIFGTFAGMALLLAAGGLYGTLLYIAGQRKREMGIRLALGASRGRIEVQVVRTGVALGLVGVTVGLGAAWLSNRLLQSRIWGVGADDPWTLGTAAVVLLVTAVLASWLPARRAGRVDPVEALRVE